MIYKMLEKFHLYPLFDSVQSQYIYYNLEIITSVVLPKAISFVPQGYFSLRDVSKL